MSYFIETSLKLSGWERSWTAVMNTGHITKLAVIFHVNQMEFEIVNY